MNTIKSLLVTALIAITATLPAQNIFFPTKVGTVLTFVQKDDNGQITGYTRQTIKSVNGSGSNMTISYLYESMDEDRNVVVSAPCQMVIKDDVMIFDNKHVFVGQLKSSNEKLVDVTGSSMQFPNSLAPGQSIKDAHLNAEIHKGITVHAKVDMINGKCVAIEDVKTQAGTFKSHKITQDVTTSVLGRTTPTHVTSWGAPGIGIVKIETRDEHGAMKNTTELVEIK